MRLPLLCSTLLATALAVSLTTPAFASDPTFADETVPPALSAPDAPSFPVTPSASPPQSDKPSGLTSSGPTEKYWYGYQTLIADGASLGAMLLGSATPAFGYIGVGGYLAGGPIVHFANKNPGAAVTSMLMRPLLPVLGAVIGYAAAGTCREKPNQPGEFDILGNCFLHGVGEAAIGALVGMSIAVTIDAAALARGERPVERPQEAKKIDGRVHVTGVAPSYDPRSGTASVGLGGTF